MRLSVTHTLGLCPKPRTRREAGLGMIHPSPAPASSVLGLQGVKRLSRHKRERKNLSRIYSTVLLTPFQPFLPALSQMSQKPRKKAYKGCHAWEVMVCDDLVDLKLSTGLLHCCGVQRESTRHASQGRPAGMIRSAKNGCAVHRAGLPMNTVIGVARDDLG